MVILSPFGSLKALRLHSLCFLWKTVIQNVCFCVNKTNVYMIGWNDMIRLSKNIQNTWFIFERTIALTQELFFWAVFFPTACCLAVFGTSFFIFTFWLSRFFMQTNVCCWVMCCRIFQWYSSFHSLRSALVKVMLPYSKPWVHYECG